jgi:hypothetical protein
MNPLSQKKEYKALVDKIKEIADKIIKDTQK